MASVLFFLLSPKTIRKTSVKTTPQIRRGGAFNSLKKN
jgi:hypothetical protein